MSDPGALANAWPALRLAAALTCVGTAIASAEWLAPLAKLAPEGLVLAGSRPRGPAAALWYGGGIRVTVLLRLLLSLGFVACVAAGSAGGTPATAAIVGAAVAALPLRLAEPAGIWVGMNGAEHVLTANLLALAAAYAAGTPLAAAAALVFVALRAFIEYGAAGWIKLTDARGWASGRNLILVLESPDYGHPGLARLVRRRPEVAAAASLAVIAVEIAVPAALFLPSPWAELLLAGAFAFHLTVAIVMGLNTFVWAFAAAYPAILYCRDLIAAALG
jgi:hypothetical protein